MFIEHQISILLQFLKDHVTLNTEAENSALPSDFKQSVELQVNV